ncbi:TBC1 domain family member 20-like isoform X2 [Corticium candelabrum]|uniref:TBC1 domain family member 20-like isoform X2 n=1 Tax=Corticium candelabrum TaxID=121492 RepID=UPI002E25D33B|nr:TBC1 domain family member 20-like isoform X2 [Corticium candelabrum]
MEKLSSLDGLHRLDSSGAANSSRRPLSSGVDAEQRRQKVRDVNKALEHDPVDVTALRKIALSSGGLINEHLRQRVWPKLLAVDVHLPVTYPADFERHKDFDQVKLDVRRSDRRFPPGVRARFRRFKQQELTEGFHELAVPFLLVCGSDICCRLLVQLCHSHLREYMGVSMSEANVLLDFLYPLIAEHDDELERFLVRSEVGTVFSLSWMITWFSHVLPDLSMVYRLYDVFLASHPLFPIYLVAMIVLDKRKEILSVDCELSAVHSVLSHLINEHLPMEVLISKSINFFKQNPPAMLASRHRLDIDKSLVMAGYRSLQEKLLRQRPDRILRSRLKKNQQKDSKDSGMLSIQSVAQVAAWTFSVAFGAAAYLLYESW